MLFSSLLHRFQVDSEAIEKQSLFIHSALDRKVLITEIHATVLSATTGMNPHPGVGI